MIILDTNVFSETVKPRPEPQVLAWLAAQRYRDVFLTAITTAEVLHGFGRMPVGKRRAQLESAVDALFRHEFAGRILPFDEAAAISYAQVMGGREAAGRPIQTCDAQIAAIARVHSAVVSTRNTKDFELCGVVLVNPWTV
jgi:toxin FitB